MVVTRRWRLFGFLPISSAWFGRPGVVLESLLTVIKMSEPTYTLLTSGDGDSTLSRRSHPSTARNKLRLTTCPPANEASASTPRSISSSLTPSPMPSHHTSLPSHLADFQLQGRMFLFSGKQAICKKASSRLVRSPSSLLATRFSTTQHVLTCSRLVHSTADNPYQTRSPQDMIDRLKSVFPSLLVRPPSSIRFEVVNAQGWTLVSDAVWKDVMVDTPTTRIRVSIAITGRELILRELIAFPLYPARHSWLSLTSGLCVHVEWALCIFYLSLFGCSLLGWSTSRAGQLWSFAFP
jgi:hypothetical protein